VLTTNARYLVREKLTVVFMGPGEPPRVFAQDVDRFFSACACSD
jgi:hypothetical protein